MVGPGPKKGWETLIYMSVRAPGAMRRAFIYCYYRSHFCTLNDKQRLPKKRLVRDKSQDALGLKSEFGASEKQFTQKASNQPECQKQFNKILN